MRVVLREFLSQTRIYSSAAHVRSIPNRGPSVLVPLTSGQKPAGRLAVQWVRDRAEDVTRSVAQLFLGTYMVWDARRQRLTETYFAVHDTQGRPLEPASTQPAGGHT